MPNSKKMMLWGIVLASVGLIVAVAVVPVLAGYLNPTYETQPLVTAAYGLISIVQQATFFGGLFLISGSFVVKAAEDAAHSIERFGSSTSRTPEKEEGYNAE